jgi:pyruvate formate lyase activating enzyme
VAPRPRFFHPEPAGKAARCDLCPRRCLLKDGDTGACKVRGGTGGGLALPCYGFVTALARDPIEKKPLYHFRPGSSIVSAGFAGCNLRCPFCQNWHISQQTAGPGRCFTPAGLAAEAAGGAEAQIAYTYSEPLVHAEFLLDCMREVRRLGAANVLVTNGCVNPEAADEILSLTDAVNIDLKCFSALTYAEVLGGDLDTVLAFITRAHEKGVHVEITTLVVPGLNDGGGEPQKTVDFIAGLSPAIPFHLTACHPDWRWKGPPASPALLASLAAGAGKKLLYVYSGNTPRERNDTLCPACGAVLVSRRGFRVDTRGLVLKSEAGGKGYFCASCGIKAPVTYGAVRTNEEPAPRRRQ